MASMAYRLFCVCALIFLLATPSARAAVSCGAAVSAIAPCIPYATGRNSIPSPACCNGARRLLSLATTTADRRAICVCLKAYAPKVKGLIPSRISGVPSACGVNFPFPISINTNCNAIP